MRHKVLIVNVFFDEHRRRSGSPLRIPRGSGQIFLAGAFNPETVDVQVYSEQTDGYLLDLELLSWPDMLVLTGLTSGIDRMLHLAAYAKTLNPRVVTVAGGPAVRALPRFSAARFDHACLGDVEELRDVAIAEWGEDVAVPPGDLFPRMDLADGRGRVGYVESSRYCNFNCAFCSLSGEGRSYRRYGLDHLLRQIEATGKRQIVFLDNNFYGNDRGYFSDRIDLLRDLKRRGTINGWSALVTGDFFARQANLEMAAKAGCMTLFTGVESFDEAQLSAYNKKQNNAVPQVEMIRNCLEHGIMFQFGIMLDPSTRHIGDLDREIDFILSMPDIPLPAYFTLPIPILGTPYFRQCLDAGLLLQNIRLRNMNGLSLLVRPRDGVDEAVRFARRLVDLSGRKARVFAHGLRFAAHHARRLSPLQHAVALASSVLTTFPGAATAPGKLWRKRPELTFYAPTEPDDPVYAPVMPVDPAFVRHFEQTRLTDWESAITSELAPDLLAESDTSRPAVAG